MDNEYKVSWIDTNPQNSSYKNEYFAGNKISKKNQSANIEDKYEQCFEKGMLDVLNEKEVKSKLTSVILHLPETDTEKLVDNIPYDFITHYSSNF